MVNVVLYALAEDASAEFHWLDIRAPKDGSQAYDPAGMGWIEERRLWTVDPGDVFAPDELRGNAAIFELIRDDEPPETLARLADFLRLPEAMQRVLGTLPSGGEPGVLAVANAHRAAEAFPGSTLPPILDALGWAGYSLLVGYTGPPPPVRSSFDRVLRIDGADPSDWRNADLTLETGPSVGELATGGTAKLVDLPFVARVLGRVIPRT